MKMKKFDLAIAMVILSGAVTNVAFAEKDLCTGKQMSDKQMLQRALDYQEIINAASLHEYYHTAWDHGGEVKNIWSKRDDVTWTNNTDRYAGRKDFEQFYVAGLKAFNTTGVMAYHQMNTPVVQISHDGKTAQALFMSTGNVTGPGMGGGEASAQWTQETYGIDFVKEDDGWKIWHLITYVDYYADYDKGWTKNNMSYTSPERVAQLKASKEKKAAIQEEPGVSFAMAKPTEQDLYYQGYHTSREPALLPLPRPYCSFDQVKPY